MYFPKHWKIVLLVPVTPSILERKVSVDVTSVPWVVSPRLKCQKEMAMCPLWRGPWLGRATASLSGRNVGPVSRPRIFPSTPLILTNSHQVLIFIHMGMQNKENTIRTYVFIKCVVSLKHFICPVKTNHLLSPNSSTFSRHLYPSQPQHYSLVRVSRLAWGFSCYY